MGILWAHMGAIGCIGLIWRIIGGMIKNPPIHVVVVATKQIAPVPGLFNDRCAIQYGTDQWTPNRPHLIQRLTTKWPRNV